MRHGLLDISIGLRSALPRVLLATVLITTAACAAAPINKPIEGGPVSTGAGSLTEARKYLEGRWALESFEVHPQGKPVVTLKGQGTLTYDAFGNLRMEIRADQAASDALRAGGIDITDGTISSNGRTVVDIANKTLTYTIEGQPAAGAGPLSMNRPRYWQVDGSLLTLTTKDDAGNVATVGRWRKTQ
jgi:adhesin HecA-like repeat protein